MTRPMGGAGMGKVTQSLTPAFMLVPLEHVCSCGPSPQCGWALLCPAQQYSCRMPGLQKCRMKCPLGTKAAQRFAHFAGVHSHSPVFPSACPDAFSAPLPFLPVLCISFSEAERDFALKLFMSNHFLLGSSSDSN